MRKKREENRAGKGERERHKTWRVRTKEWIMGFGFGVLSLSFYISLGQYLFGSIIF